MYKSFHEEEELENKSAGKLKWKKLKFLVKMKKEELGFVDKLKAYMVSNRILKYVCHCFLKGEKLQKQTKHMQKI